MRVEFRFGIDQFRLEDSEELLRMQMQFGIAVDCITAFDIPAAGSEYSFAIGIECRTFGIDSKSDAAC